MEPFKFLSDLAYKRKMEYIEKEAIQRNRIIYHKPCRIDNWFNDKSTLEENGEISKFKELKSNLLIQKTKNMFRNLTEKTSLDKDTEFVKYNNHYLLRALDVPNLLTPECRMRGNVNGLFLAGLVTEREIDTIENLSHGCKLSASINRKPCTRNTFKLVNCDDKNSNDYVLYGQYFFLQIANENLHFPLYVRCENTTLSTLGSEIEVFLSQAPDSHCRFKTLHWDQNLRRETYGSKVYQGERLVIQHSASGQNLSVHYTCLLPTFFGMEAKVLCKTFKDDKKKDKIENFWSFLGATPLNKNMVVRAAQGEDIPDFYLE